MIFHLNFLRHLIAISALLFITNNAIADDYSAKRIARFDQGLLRYSNWNAPYVTVDTCLDIAATDIIVPDTVFFRGRPYPVVEIGPNAFKGFKHLTSVILGDSVQNILKGAFLDCPRLRVIEVRRPRPPHIGMHPFYRGEWYEVFEPYHTLTSVLVVPKGYEQVYRNAPGWGEFKVIQSTWPTNEELNIPDIDVRINLLEKELIHLQERAIKLQNELEILRNARTQ